jgi:threonine dehydrogenase-like Zn-dependent dehydrogenase
VRSAERYGLLCSGSLCFSNCVLYLSLFSLDEDPTRRIIVTDVSQERLSLIEEFGGEPILVDQLDKQEPDLQFDAVVEVCGFVGVLPQGIKRIRFGGVYGLVGVVHPNSALGDITGEQVCLFVFVCVGIVFVNSCVSLSKIIRRCVQMYGIHNYAPSHLDAAVAFLDKTNEQFPFDKLVSPTALPLGDLGKGVELSEQRQYHRVAVNPSPPK